LIVAWFGAGPLGVRRDDRIAAVFAGSQKTLPIGLLIATDPRLLGGGKLSFAMLPMLMYHASQLIIDTVVAARLSAGNEQLQPASSEPATGAGTVIESSGEAAT
jgi:sodium/bile acid cotransporter 7